MTEALTLEQQLVGSWPAKAWSDVHVVLAVSGGPDSVALLRALSAVKRRMGGSGKLYVAHFNHGLRGKAADDDQAWVETLCGRLDIPLTTGSEDVAALADREGDGREAAARQARYDFLLRTAQKLGARYVATAHTADDQVETVLHRILRGTGLAGLRGIRRVRALSPTVSVVRPFLGISRQAVHDYLQQIDQEFRIDETNAQPEFYRNRIRNELLPTLRTHYNHGIDEILLRLASQAGDVMSSLEPMVASRVDDCIKRENDLLTVDVASLKSEPRYVICEVLRTAWERAGWPLGSMGFEHWQRLADLVLDEGAQTAITLPGDTQAQRTGEWVTLRRSP